VRIKNSGIKGTLEFQMGVANRGKPAFKINEVSSDIALPLSYVDPLGGLLGGHVPKTHLFTSAMIAALLLPLSAQAQRADENAVNSAEDAFGVSIGDQNVGLYNDRSARGFSPQQAGNIRIDGLYFDQQFGLLGRIDAGTTMRVGLSAQSYAFPAPTGIADIQLRRPGDQTTGSFGLTYGPYGGIEAEADLQTPIIAGKLGAVASLAASSKKYDWRGTFTNLVFAGSLNWTPTDNIDVLVYGQGLNGRDGESQPLLFTAGAFTPPRYDRSVYFGQWWAARNRDARNMGTIINAAPADGWRIRAGLFRSINNLKDEFVIFFRDIQPDGSAQLEILRSQPQYAASTSGEVRASRIINEGLRQHTFHFSVKGRDVLRRFGGADRVSFGATQIGVFTALPEPSFNLTDRSRDDVFQVTPGFSYVGRWLNVGEFSVGVQKSFYKRKVNQPGAPEARTNDKPWLYNGTFAINLSESVALYAGYTRGLEESGIAPDTAINRGEALPASITEQIDAGVRYRITPQLTAIAGVFEVKKPFFERDATNLFRDVGGVSHRGIELSLSGQPLPGLTVVAGAMLLRARIDGGQSTAGVIGAVPIARPSRNIRLNIQYGPKEWRGFLLTGAVINDGPMYADRANTFKLPSTTTFDLGARYNFNVFGNSASARLQVHNVTNDFSWSVQSSGAYVPSKARRFTVSLVTDF
jgi:iron complex outermembrane recepter protein